MLLFTGMHGDASPHDYLPPNVLALEDASHSETPTFASAKIHFDHTA